MFIYVTPGWCTHKAITMSTTKRKLRHESIIKQPQLEEFLNNSYVLDRSQNYEQFLREIGIRRITRARALRSKPTVMLSRENGEYILATNYSERRYIRVRFKPEVEVLRRRPIPNPARSVFHVLDNKLIEEQQIEDVKILIVREFNKKDLLVTMEVNNVKCYRWYRLVQRSMQSIRTETSRRSYLWETKDSEVGSMPSLSQGVDETENDFESDTDEESLCY